VSGAFAALAENEREVAWSGWLVIAPVVKDGVPLTAVAG